MPICRQFVRETLSGCIVSDLRPLALRSEPQLSCLQNGRAATLPRAALQIIPRPWALAGLFLARIPRGDPPKTPGGTELNKGDKHGGRGQPQF